MSFENVDTQGSAPTTSDPTIQDSNVAPSTTPTAPVAAPAQPQSTSTDGMVPSYRIRETREQVARQLSEQWQQREAAYSARMEAMQRQLQALVGVTPQGDPEVNAIRSQFAKLYPGLAQLEQRAQDIAGLLERGQDLNAQTEHYWTSYGRQTMDRLYSKAQEALGSPLSPQGKRALHAAFSGYVASDPEVMQRYTSDPTLVDEFMRDWTSSFIDPVRRAQAAAAQTQTAATARTFPQDSPSGAPQMSPAPKPASLDERAAMAWAHFSNPNRNG